MPLLPGEVVDYTILRARKGWIEYCPQCGRKGHVYTRPNGDRIFDHRVRLENVGGITITHTDDRCYIRQEGQP